MSEQSLPRFLKHSELVALNDHLQKKTGCFAFLNPYPLMIREEPRSYRDAFILFSIGLYVVYYDFGCEYLNFFLDDGLCPPALPLPANHKMHKDKICKTLRPAMAHGLYDKQKEAFVTVLAKYYIRTPSLAQQTWSECLDQITEAQWEIAATRLKRDADNFYDFLMAWGDAKRANLRTQFAQNSAFQNSIGRRICEPILRDSGVFDKNEKDRYLSTSDPSSNILNWRNTLIQEYSSGALENADALYDKLCKLIKRDVSLANRSSSSSADKGAKHGFSIPR